MEPKQQQKQQQEQLTCSAHKKVQRLLVVKSLRLQLCVSLSLCVLLANAYPGISFQVYVVVHLLARRLTFIEHLYNRAL